MSGGQDYYVDDEEEDMSEESQEDDSLAPLERFHKYRTSHLLLQR